MKDVDDFVDYGLSIEQVCVVVDLYVDVDYFVLVL